MVLEKGKLYKKVGDTYVEITTQDASVPALIDALALNGSGTPNAIAGNFIANLETNSLKVSNNVGTGPKVEILKEGSLGLRINDGVVDVFKAYVGTDIPSGFVSGDVVIGDIPTKPEPSEISTLKGLLWNNTTKELNIFGNLTTSGTIFSTRLTGGSLHMSRMVSGFPSDIVRLAVQTVNGVDVPSFIPSGVTGVGSAYVRCIPWTLRQTITSGWQILLGTNVEVNRATLAGMAFIVSFISAANQQVAILSFGSSVPYTPRITVLTGETPRLRITDVYVEAFGPARIMLTALNLGNTDPW